MTCCKKNLALPLLYNHTLQNDKRLFFTHDLLKNFQIYISYLVFIIIITVLYYKILQNETRCFCILEGGAVFLCLEVKNKTSRYDDKIQQTRKNDGLGNVKKYKMLK